MVVDVPAGLVTVTSTVPFVPAGLVTVSCVSLITVRFEAATVPKFAVVAPVNPLPVSRTNLPPRVGPLLGLTSVTAGAVPGPVVSPVEATGGRVACSDEICAVRAPK